MTLSIIVPVYNVEKYLDFCLKTICRQRVDACEIILVDDCSPDRSGIICDEWAARDARIRVVHCPTNGGLSAARNAGLDIATGDYITFIDSDDYIAPNTLQENMELLRAHREADVLEYPVCVHHGTQRSYRYRPGRNRIEDFAGWVKRKGYVHSYACNKIYRRSLWKNHRFPVGKHFEDSYTIPYLLREAHGILCSNHGLYYYCSREGSISNSLTIKKEEDLLQSTLELWNFINKEVELSEKDRDEMYLTLCNNQIIYLQLGGRHLIPEHKIPLRRALLTKRPKRMYIKAVMKSICGSKYCKMIAGTRKIMKK